MNGALFLLASLSMPTTIASLSAAAPLNYCEVSINLTQMFADVSCDGPVSLDEALSYVNEVALKNNAGQFLTYPTVVVGLVKNTKWHMPLIPYQ